MLYRFPPGKTVGTGRNRATPRARSSRSTRYYAADARQRIERHTLLHQLLRDLLGVMLRVLGDVIVDMT